ncbi:unnamed protein product [Symbiodinium microadriaticum]|nr:unnamed protein product [Symbiodinium sp. KB8]CAE7493163.1 unnamed protein product [Symbiodinium microadriaticum]
MPFLEVFAGRPAPGQGKKSLLNLAVAQLSYLYLGCPTDCPSSVSLGVPLNRKQWKAVRGLRHLVFGSFFPLHYEPSDYGRIGHKVEGQDKVLGALSCAAASVCHDLGGYLPRSLLRKHHLLTWSASFLASRTLLLCRSRPTDRLILDARPANALEDFPCPGRWVHTLASAACLGGIVIELKEGQTLLLAGADLVDCFYQFRVSSQRATRNLLACALTPTEAAFVFERPASDFRAPGSVVYCGLSSLAMGDSSACEFAQCSHLGVLLQGRALQVGELMVQAQAPRRGLLSVGLVIDDLIILQRCLTEQLPEFAKRPGTSAGSQRLRAALAAYDRACLRYSSEKTFEDKTQASFWGVDCCGISGLVRPNPSRFWPLVLITIRVIQLGLATRSLLESLVGSWVSVFMVRRRLLSLVNLCFQAIREGPSQAILRLSPELKAELAAFVCLGHLAVLDLRCLADDHRHGCFQFLASEVTYSAHPVAEAAARVPAYKCLWRREYKNRVHINVAELGAYLREEARVAGRYPASRPLFGLDAQVCLGCLCKGRSASGILNRMLAASLGPLLSSRVFPEHLFFPSSLNPADDPTRHLSARAPSCRKPAWWIALEDGNSSPLEAFLLEREDAAANNFEQTDLLELGGSRPVVFQSNRERESRRPRLQAQRSRLAWNPPKEVLRLPCNELAGVPSPATTPGGVFGSAVVDALATFAWPSKVFVQSRLLLSPGCSPPGPVSNSAGWAWASFACYVPQGPRRQPFASWLLRCRDFALESTAAYSVEAPDCAYFWQMPGWRPESQPGSPATFRADLCQFWRKRTRVATNSSLASARLLCASKVRHLRLLNWSSTHRLPWTAVAEHYPAGFSDVLVLGLCCHAGWTYARPTAAAVVSVKPKTLGLAVAPGSPATFASMATAWTSFLGCVSLFLSVDPLGLFASCPVQSLQPWSSALTDNEDAITLIVMAFGGLGRDERWFPLSPSAYRSRWDKCLKTLGLEGLVDVTPGGLHGGGAVAAYHCGGAIAEVAAVAALDSASEDSKLLIRFALQLLDTARDVATAVFDPSAAPNAAHKSSMNRIELDKNVKTRLCIARFLWLYVLVTIYVDDILTAGKPDALKDFWAQVATHVEIEAPSDVDRCSPTTEDEMISLAEGLFVEALPVQDLL